MKRVLGWLATLCAVVLVPVSTAFVPGCGSDPSASPECNGDVDTSLNRGVEGAWLCAGETHVYRLDVDGDVSFQGDGEAHGEHSDGTVYDGESFTVSLSTCPEFNDTGGVILPSPDDSLTLTSTDDVRYDLLLSATTTCGDE